jgi:hypothetical protein
MARLRIKARRAPIKERNPVPLWYVVYLLGGPAVGFAVGFVTPSVLAKLGLDSAGGFEHSRLVFTLVFTLIGACISLYFATIKAFHELFSRMLQEQLKQGLDQISISQTLQKIPSNADPAAALESVKNLADFIHSACNEHGGALLGRSAFMISKFKTRDLQRLLVHGEGIDCIPDHYTKAMDQLSETMTDLLLIDSSVPENSDDFKVFLKNLQARRSVGKEYILCCDPQVVTDSADALKRYRKSLNDIGFKTYWTNKQVLDRQGLPKDYSTGPRGGGFHHIFGIDGRRIAFTLYVENPKNMNESRKDLVIAPVIPGHEFDQWLDACKRLKEDLTDKLIETKIATVAVR